jgi:hypothetical protein
MLCAENSFGAYVIQLVVKRTNLQLVFKHKMLPFFELFPEKKQANSI